MHVCLCVFRQLHCYLCVALFNIYDIYLQEVNKLCSVSNCKHFRISLLLSLGGFVFSEQVVIACFKDYLKAA